MLEKKRVFSWKTYVPYAESLRIVILRYLEKFLGFLVFLVFLGQGNSEKPKKTRKLKKQRNVTHYLWHRRLFFWHETICTISQSKTLLDLVQHQ